MRRYLKYLRRYSVHPAHSDIFSTSADSQYKAKNKAFKHIPKN